MEVDASIHDALLSFIKELGVETKHDTLCYSIPTQSINIRHFEQEEILHAMSVFTKAKPKFVACTYLGIWESVIFDYLSFVLYVTFESNETYMIRYSHRWINDNKRTISVQVADAKEAFNSIYGNPDYEYGERKREGFDRQQHFINIMEKQSMLEAIISTNLVYSYRREKDSFVILYTAD